MKRSSVIAIVFACALVLALVWLLRTPRRETAILAPSSHAAPTTGSSEFALDGVDVAGPRERTASESAAVAANASHSPPRVDEIVLRILRHDSGEPVPDADVFVMDMATSRSQVSFYTDPLAGLDEVEARGTRHKSDADGRVAMPVDDRRLLIYAERGELAGFVHIVGYEPPPDLYLHPDRALTVQVVDESGAPRSGIEVALAWKGSGRFSETFRRATTSGERGSVELTRVGLLMAIEPGADIRARIHALLEPPVESRIARAELARGSVVLVLPATGEMEIAVQDKDGVSWPDPVDVNLRIDRLEGPRLPDWSARWFTLRQVKGRTIVPRVALGAHVFARATLPDDRRVEADAAGPISEGEHRTLVIAVDRAAEAPMLEARLLDAEGSPAADATLGVALAWGNPILSRSFRDARTDDRGVVRVRADQFARANGMGRLYVGRQLDDGSIGQATFADVAVPLPNERIPLGDLVLREGALLCAGMVVDAQGQPIEQAEVWLHGRGRHLGFFASLLRTRSRADGAFAIHGLLEADSVHVIARARGYGEQSAEIALGRTDVTLVLAPAARIEGSIAASAKFRMDELSIGCQATRWQSNRAYSSRATPAHGTGAFSFASLAAGEFRVTLFTHPMVGEPVDLGLIQANPGEVTRDPRLQSIDADARLHTFEIRAFDSEGRALTAFQLQARAGDAPDAFFEIYEDVHDGELRIASVSDEIEVLVSAEGYRAVTAICGEGPTRVTLPAALDVTLRIDGVLDLLGETFELVPVLHFTGRVEFMENVGALPFDRDGNCRFAAANPGAHELSFVLRKRAGRQGQPFAETEPQVIEVGDTPAPQTFQVRLSREVLERELAKLRE